MAQSTTAPHLSSKEAYDELKKRFADIKKLNYANEILNNDMEVSMPSESEDDRVEQITAVSMAMYRLITDPKTEELLNLAELDIDSLEIIDQRNLHLMRSDWTHQNALSEELAAEVAKVGSRGNSAHVKNYKSGDWASVSEWYEYSFDVARRVGEAKAKALGLSSPYQALVDNFSPGLSVAVIEKEFSKLDVALRVMVPEAMAYQAAQPVIPLEGIFSIEKQKELNLRLAKSIGFDMKRGRLDFIGGHPSMCGSPDDTRITSKPEETDFLSSLYSTAHEAGHGIYNQNLPEAYRYQPVGNDLGMAVHESQSHIIDEHACKNTEFFQFLSREAKRVFDRPNDPALTPENLQRLSCTARPSYIRIEADELTYSQHVIHRFEIEKSIINDRAIDVKEELPRVWWEGMKERLGLEAMGDEKGCMQDVHWPIGLQGYFPAYTLGSMMAAQFYAAAVRERPEIEPEIGQGNFTPLQEWLKSNVHGRGSEVETSQLLIDATGEDLNARYYLESLSQRFLNKPFQPI